MKQVKLGKNITSRKPLSLFVFSVVDDKNVKTLPDPDEMPGLFRRLSMTMLILGNLRTRLFNSSSHSSVTSVTDCNHDRDKSSKSE